MSAQMKDAKTVIVEHRDNRDVSRGTKEKTMTTDAGPTKFEIVDGRPTDVIRIFDQETRRPVDVRVHVDPSKHRSSLEYWRPSGSNGEILATYPTSRTRDLPQWPIASEYDIVRDDFATFNRDMVHALRARLELACEFMAERMVEAKAIGCAEVADDFGRIIAACREPKP